ncbi:hypothetical protein [uncultured Prevotellamassilia sp.]|uniref:hypothetical protein n=1 Tax=uncultured Prevotellamassilia sp. TaxID=1926676 RepID=UPI0025949ED4|nr:hypothetical protein [uncultured Prevotellamassilia sp.]
MMNNEETIIMQPQSGNNPKANQAAPAAEPNAKPKKTRGKRSAAMAGAAVVGAAVGSGATLGVEAVVDDSNNDQEENNAQTAETQTDNAAESQEVEAVADTQDGIETEQPQYVSEAPRDVNATVDDVAPNGENDYTGHGGGNFVAQDDPNLQTASDDGMGVHDDQLQVLGVYDVQNEDGSMMQTATITDGHYIGAVIDADYDGTADAVIVDYNQNQQIEEGEVFDVSNENIQMQDFQDAHVAQQQDMMQQEQEHLAYNASDDQPDYCNNADIQDA